MRNRKQNQPISCIAETREFTNTLTMSDRRIADRMSSYLANFIATVDPDGAGPPPRVPAGDKPAVMEVGDKNGPIPAAGNAARYAFFEKHLSVDE
ncbi:MAG: hypothetical protein JW793_07585 [Acidobacteria bacterium]|nr:hypothetical protein [Acidobacteriota bacterium]